MDKISIIIPIYNAEKYIQRCVDSVIEQTYKNFELILVNDGSTDKSLEIMKQYEEKDNRIIVIDKENTGVSDTRNVGIKVATGNFITFMDVDDWVEDNILEEMLNQQRKFNVDVIRCSYFRNYVDSTQVIGCKYDDDICQKVLDKKEIINKILTQILSGKMPGYMWLLLIKKETFNKLKPLNTKLTMFEDTLFYVNMLLNINSMYIYDKPLYHYFCNEDSASKSYKNYEKNIKNILSVNEYIEKELIENNLDELKKIYYTAHAKSIENIFFRIFKNNKRQDIKDIYTRILEMKKIYEIINKADKSSIKIHQKIAIFLIKNKHKNLLIKYYSFRNILSNIKTVLTKRKEV